MPDKVFLTTLAADALFLATGGIQLGFCLIVQSHLNDVPKTGHEATRNFLYHEFPFTAGIVNGIFILVTFLLTLPGLLMSVRTWLKASGYMITVCGIFTLCIGVFLWVLTLRVKENLFPVFSSADESIQSLIQTSFDCCGYFNSTSPAFITDSTCPSPAAAQTLRGCATSISSYSNVFLDNIFTAVFGMVGVDAVLILSIACLLKTRKERERYRHIDEKRGI